MFDHNNPNVHKVCKAHWLQKLNHDGTRITTVQVRDKRPTHTQNARTIFAQTRVKKRVPKHVFARIQMRVFPFAIHSHNCPLCCILLHNKRARQKAVPTNTAEKYLCRETNSRMARCWCTVAKH